MSWDDDSFADEYGERHPGRPPATGRQILARVAAYVGMVAGIVALIAGTIHVVGLIGLAANPGGFAAAPAYSPRVAIPPMTPLDDEASGTGAPMERSEEGGDESLSVSGSETGVIEPGWMTRTAAVTGIPERALAAYALAHGTIAAAEPECGLDWATIAAIGAIESRHGTHGGAILDEHGVATPAIIGRALDGDGVATIRDTDGGLLDGDSTWDRAVGPMQFIPSTWARWASDANGDGVADPHQIDDAAETTARYLCASGPMTSPEGWRAAIFSYNPDNDYVDKVARVANEYAASIG